MKTVLKEIFENKQKGNNYFGDIYFKEKYFNY